MAPSSGLLTCFILINTFFFATAWDNEDFEIFDIVEEVNANFYEVLGVDRSSTTAEIRKAYRKQSLVLHPDKNDAPDAEEKFRQAGQEKSANDLLPWTQHVVNHFWHSAKTASTYKEFILVAVYEVLKDENKREKYNSVLENGLPDWRQPVFYYRRVRKMGILELSALLFIILTVGQYLVLWSIYIERRLTVEETFLSKKKRGRKKQHINDEIEDAMQVEIDSMPKPRLADLWPVTFTKFTVHTVISLPRYIREAQERKKEIQRQEEERLLREQEEKEREEEVEPRRPKRKPKSDILEGAPVVCADGAPVVYGVEDVGKDDEEEVYKQKEKSGEWTEEDHILLAKAVAKFPGGTPKRWEKIADMVGRPVAEVTAKSKEAKGTYVMNLSPSVQGGVVKPAKRNVEISDQIISKTDCDVLLNGAVDSEESSVRRRHKVKVTKDTQRTLLISKQQPVQNDKNLTGSGSTEQKPTKVTANVNQTQSGSAQKSSLVTDLKSAKMSAARSEMVPVTSPDIEAKEDSDIWTQNQQVILEWALKQYPKGAEQRWEKIAEHIPGKNKDDCISRFKYLAEMLKKRKNQQS